MTSTVSSPKGTSAVLKYALYFVVFGAMISRGAFFTGWLILLNITFLIYIIFQKNTVALDLTAFFLLGLFLAALASLFIVKTNIGTALEELPKYSLFPLSYIAFLTFDDKELAKKIFYRAIIFLAAAGIMAICGLPLMSNMIIEESGRLQSFLQYANTTAMLFSAGIFLAADYFVKTKKIAHIVSALIMLTALIFTQSRIGFWVFAAVFILYAVFRIPKKIRRYAILALLAVIFALVVFGYRIIAISLFEPTLVERILTYSDGISMLKSNPFGIGMGQWQFQHLRFQTAPYYIKYIHCVYLQIALDCGLVGLLCFLGAVVNSLIRGLKEKNVCFFIVLLIAGGSVVEVNFAFGIVIIFFGLMLSCTGTKCKRYRFKTAVRLPLIIPAVALTMLLVCESALYVGRLNKNNSQRAIAAYETALFFNPWKYTALHEIAKSESGAQRILEYLERAISENPIDRSLLVDLTAGYNHIEDYPKALMYAERLFNLHTYSKETQGIYKDTLTAAFENGAITKSRFDDELSSLLSRIDDANSNINPLYRYMNPDMDYRR